MGACSVTVDLAHLKKRSMLDARESKVEVALGNSTSAKMAFPASSAEPSSGPITESLRPKSDPRGPKASTISHHKAKALALSDSSALDQDAR